MNEYDYIIKPEINTNFKNSSDFSKITSFINFVLLNLMIGLIALYIETRNTKVFRTVSKAYLIELLIRLLR